MASLTRHRRHRAAVIILSHRPALVPEALASATGQTVPCQVAVQFSAQNWSTKVNDMVAATDAEWVCVLCDDDLLHPRYLERCLRFADGADVIYTNRTVFGKDAPTDAAYWMGQHRTHGREVSGATDSRTAYRTRLCWQDFAFGSPLLMTILVRRSLWDAHGGYDGTINHADTEFWFRVIRGSADGRVKPARTVYVDEPLMYYRNHATQGSRTHDTFPSFVRAFHWKHFNDFGILHHGGTGRDGHHMQLEPVAPHLRAACWAATHTPLTSSGAMATESIPLSPTHKKLMQYALAEATRQTQEVVESIMAEAAKAPSEGWRIDPLAFAFVRELPETPIPVIPAETPLEIVSRNETPLPSVADEPTA